MAVSVRPIAIGAKPAGARLEVAAMKTKTRKALSTVAIRNTATRPARSIDSAA
jgi:hypothetical protein